MTAHAFDNKLQQMKVLDTVVTGFTEKVLDSIIDQTFGRNSFMAHICKDVAHEAIEEPLKDALNLCQAVENVSNDPQAASDFLAATVGKSHIPPGFDQLKPKEKADCIVDLLDKNHTDVDPSQVDRILNASHSSNGRPLHGLALATSMKAVCSGLPKKP